MSGAGGAERGLRTVDPGRMSTTEGSPSAEVRFATYRAEAATLDAVCATLLKFSRKLRSRTPLTAFVALR